MTESFSTPWHRESFDDLMNSQLPRLISRRLPMSGYAFEPTGDEECCISVLLGTPGREIALAFKAIPRPNADGVLRVGGRRIVVPPIAGSEDLETEEIRCIGDQLFGFIEARLGSAPADLPWDSALATALFPLDSWVRAFLDQAGQDLDDTNWLSLHTHLRRLTIPGRRRVSTRAQIGRTCPIESPEGPNVGRLLTIARGAAVRDGVLAIDDPRPEAGLGLSASMIPFLEHNEPVRSVMGANMMRQWLAPPDPEPALVQTGLEPEAPEFWCGRSLLTAFVCRDADTFEDAILISESCARRFGYPVPIEAGDKLGNRHGAKGVVSRIAPDAEMPHTADGRPVELVYDSMGIFSRLNFGQVRELLLGRIAMAEGRAALAPPFAAPDETELRSRLAAAGLPPDGMEALSDSADGPVLQHRVAVGWVYWGRLSHLAADKMAVATGPQRCQRQGELEFYALRIAGAYANIAEQFNGRAASQPHAAALAARAGTERIRPGGAPSPQFAELARRLAAAGIEAALESNRVSFRLQPPSDRAIDLAVRTPHPWLHGETIDRIGALPEVAQLANVQEANARIERLAANGAPESLRARAVQELTGRLRDYFAALVSSAHMQLASRVMFGGRAVAVPSVQMGHNQVGIPDEIAWALFGPLAAAEMGDRTAVGTRTAEAAAVLDAIMARRWVLINRPPSLEPVSFLAFRAVRVPGSTIRLHPLANPLLNADFDGDVISVFLPLSEPAQQEAGERLTLAGHLRRDPELLFMLRPIMGAWAGLVLESGTPSGRATIEAAVGSPPPDTPLTRELFAGWMVRRLRDLGEEPVLDSIHRLICLGFASARHYGLSISPFIGSQVIRPPLPHGDEPAAWSFHHEALAESLLAQDDSGDSDLAAALFAVRSGARGTTALLAKLVGASGIVTDADGRTTSIRHGLTEGYSPAEFISAASSGRAAIARQAGEISTVVQAARASYGPTGMHVIARAMRARNPGLVFARAAASAESDPLVDTNSRLFVGLEP